MRKSSCDTATNVIAEAKTLAAYLVETERAKCGGDVELALHRVASIYGIEEGALRSLRYRWRDLHDVKASMLERLREAFEAIYDRQRRTAIIEREIAAIVTDEPQAEGMAVPEFYGADA